MSPTQSCLKKARLQRSIVSREGFFVEGEGKILGEKGKKADLLPSLR